MNVRCNQFNSVCMSKSDSWQEFSKKHQNQPEVYALGTQYSY